MAVFICILAYVAFHSVCILINKGKYGAWGCLLAPQIAMERLRRHNDAAAARLGTTMHRSRLDMAMYPRMSLEGDEDKE